MHILWESIWENVMKKSWAMLGVILLSILFHSLLFADDFHSNQEEDRTGMVVDIGDGYDLGHVHPASYFWKNSLSQQLFYPEEMIYEGIITRISFFYDFVDSPLNPELNIWLGETELDDLTGGNIPASELTLVYSGEIPDYAIGEGELYLNLQQLYDYYGGNLVLLVERPMDSQYWSSLDKFYLTYDNEHPNRSWDICSDSEDFDPYEINNFGNTNNYHSNFTFVIFQGATIYGHIENTDGESLSSVLVECNNQQTLSDENGEYFMEHVVTSTGDITFSKEGYQTYIDDSLELFDTAVIELDVTMEPRGPIVVGTGDLASPDLPIQYWYKNSLSETIYYQNELSEAGLESGLITQIAYNFTQNLVLPDQSIRVWVGETDQTSLPEDWITSDQLMLVYDGEMITEGEEGWLELPFMEPYPYSGENLIVMVQRPWHYNQGGNLYFYNSQTIELPERTLLAFSDLNEIDPEDIQINSSYKDRFSNTRFYYNLDNCGSVSGVILDENSQPLQGAKVTLGEHNIYTFSDSAGNFEFPIFLAGIYSLSIEKTGYENISVDNVIVATDQITEVEIALIPVTEIVSEEIEWIEAKLSQNYPNPFILVGNRGNTTIEYVLPQDMDFAELGIYNLKGQKIKTAKLDGKVRNSYFSWDGKDNHGNSVGSGIYFYRLDIGQGSEMKRMILIK